KIRSLALIILISPIEDYVEPEEDELPALPRHERARLYAAGPATNMLLAVLFAVVFSSVMLAAVTPVHDGVGIVAFTQGASPAQTAGMQAYTVITSVNNTEIHSYADFRNEMSKTVAGQNLTVVAFDPTTSASKPYHVTLVAEAGTGRPLIGIYAIDVRTDYYHPLRNSARLHGVQGADLSFIS